VKTESCAAIRLPQVHFSPEHLSDFQFEKSSLILCAVAFSYRYPSDRAVRERWTLPLSLLQVLASQSASSGYNCTGFMLVTGELHFPEISSRDTPESKRTWRSMNFRVLRTIT
jgi:hypothetical protein